MYNKGSHWPKSNTVSVFPLRNGRVPDPHEYILSDLEN